MVIKVGDMHELALAEGIIGQVKALKEEYGFGLVREIEIVCGKHNSVNGSNLEFILANQDEVGMKEARVRIVRLSRRFYCTACDVEFDNEAVDNRQCTHCGTDGSSINSHSALYIRKLEVD